MKEIGIGIVGYGFMGRTHTYAYKTIPLYYDNLPFVPKLLGVCNRTKAKAQYACQANGFAFATDEVDELLDLEGIDAVSVCTPNPDHFGTVMKAIRAGKHVYCDKPLAVSADEARQLADAAVHAGVTAQVALQNRFFPATLRAKQLMEEGRIGRITSFHGAYLHSGSVDPAKPIGWKQDHALAVGGVLFDLGSHILDLLYWLMGEYEEVLAETRILYPRRPDRSGNMVEISAEDYASLILRLKGGAVGTVEVSKIATGTNDELLFEIYGDKGAIRFNTMQPNWLEYMDNTVPESALGGTRGFTKIECVQRYEAPGGAFPSSKNSVGWLRAHVHSLYTFLENLYLGRPGSPSFEEGAYVQYVMERAYESAKARAWIPL